MGPKPVRLVCCDEGGRREGHEAGPRAGDGGGILIYYGRDWLMLMSLVLVIIERGKKRAMEVDHRIQGCQMAKFDPFLSFYCARVEGVGAQSKVRKGSNFAA